MTIIRQFTSEYPTITSMITRETYSPGVWAITASEAGICHLKKMSIYDLDVVSVDIEVEATEVIQLVNTGSYMYLLYNDSDYLGSRYSVYNPYTATVIYYTAPAEITENPIGMGVTSTYVLFLFPGTDSGKLARIAVYTLAGVYQETIDLGESGALVYDATSITVDDDNNAWITTNTTPANLIRVWYTAGEWRYVTTELSP